MLKSLTIENTVTLTVYFCTLDDGDYDLEDKRSEQTEVTI
jgi:hypothetical protein